MRFQRLDLNLLVALDALLAEKSVSLAAERIHLSQSATSSALGRLREYFADDLLIVRGRQMVLTARGEELIEPVRAVLDQIKETIAHKPQFDPATSDRAIRIMASDYISEVLLSRLMRDLATRAPNLRLEIAPMSDGPVEALERGVVDILLTVDFAISADHPSHILFEDDYVVIACQDNPHLTGPLTRDLYFELGHVTARFGKNHTPAFEDWFVRRQKQARKLDVVTSSFLSIPAFVVGTERIATVHRRHAMAIAQNMPIIIHEAPIAIPPIREAIQWHLSNNNDPAIRWFVEQAVLIARDGVAAVPASNVVELETKRSALAVDDAAQLRSDFGNRS
jgi:LysR family transcriptional regulator, nod-box dependent transcriptional activator